MATKKVNLLVEHFLGEVVTITSIQNNEQFLFQGILVDLDDKFLFIDQALDGIISCAISIDDILSIELFSNEQAVVELGDILEDLEKVSKREKKGNIQ